MSADLETLGRRLRTAIELKSVVRTMKSLAAVSIVPYEKAAHSLADYYHGVELGLIACLKDIDTPFTVDSQVTRARIGVVIFGSDQGMIGQFNENLANFVLMELRSLPGRKRVWPIGERVAWQLRAPDLDLMPVQSVPDTVAGITPLTITILEALQQHSETAEITHVLVFHNQPIAGKLYQPFQQRLLPFDRDWLRGFASRQWPTKMIPQVMPVERETLAALLQEYLFVSLFRAAAESLASENASRLAAMQVAERKIGELIEQFNVEFNQARQNSIDEELFDVIAGYEALSARSDMVQ